MVYLDYSWDLEPDRILLDAELDLAKLGWTAGDMFKVVVKDGQQMLTKIDPLELFLKGYRVNE
jgi:hypothetical protein